MSVFTPTPRHKETKTHRYYIMIKYDNQRKTYFVQYKVKDVLTGKWHTTCKRGFKLKRDAVEYEAKLNIDKQTKSPTKTFREMIVLWEDNIQSSSASRKQHQEHFEIRCSELLDKPMNKISKADLITWRNTLSNSSYSTKTKNKTMTFVKAVFKFANEIYNIPNVAVVLKPFKRTDDEILNSEMEVWTIAEYNQFRESIDNRLYQIYFDTLFWSGARRGEIIALQCDDLFEGYISIHASQRDSTSGLKPTKTKTNRKVRIDTELQAELQELKDYYKVGYLFGGDTPLSPTTISRYFNKGIKVSGVKPIRLHDLRHSHATMLINSGVNIVAVSKRLGHADIETTLKTYTHLLQDTENELINTIERKKHE